MLSQFRKAETQPSVATAGTVAPSHLLLKFGKLTSKFELLCKKLKASGLKTTAGRRTDAGTGGAKASRCGWFAVMAWDGADDVCTADVDAGNSCEPCGG